MDKYICLYRVSKGHFRYASVDGKRAAVEAESSKDAFIRFKKLFANETVGDFQMFMVINADRKKWDDSHGWDGKINYPLTKQ